MKIIEWQIIFVVLMISVDLVISDRENKGDGKGEKSKNNKKKCENQNKQHGKGKGKDQESSEKDCDDSTDEDGNVLADAVPVILVETTEIADYVTEFLTTIESNDDAVYNPESEITELDLTAPQTEPVTNDYKYTFLPTSIKFSRSTTKHPGAGRPADCMNCRHPPTSTKIPGKDHKTTVKPVRHSANHNRETNTKNNNFVLDKLRNGAGSSANQQNFWFGLYPSNRINYWYGLYLPNRRIPLTKRCLICNQLVVKKKFSRLSGCHRIQLCFENITNILAANPPTNKKQNGSLSH